MKWICLERKTLPSKQVYCACANEITENEWFNDMKSS